MQVGQRGRDQYWPLHARAMNSVAVANEAIPPIWPPSLVMGQEKRAHRVSYAPCYFLREAYYIYDTGTMQQFS